MLQEQEYHVTPDTAVEAECLIQENWVTLESLPVVLQMSISSVIIWSIMSWDSEVLVSASDDTQNEVDASWHMQDLAGLL